MPNVQSLYQLETAANYGRDGVQDWADALRRYATRHELLSDDIDVSVFADVTATVQNVSGGAANLYGISVVSPSDAAVDTFLQVFNVAAANVTLGTTLPDFVMRVPFTRTRAVVFFPGDDDTDLFDTRISMAVTTTATGSTAPAAVDRPDVTFVHTNA